MIIVKIQGGLGNQLFQYAVARHLAKIHDTSVLLDLSLYQTYTLHAYSLSPFNIHENIATPDEIDSITSSLPKFVRNLSRKLKISRFNENSRHIHEKYFHFDPDILLLPDNVYLDGYWQSEKYFIGISDIIRSEFTLKRSQSGADKEISERIRSCNSVCVHVRRGSYTRPPYNSVHGTCSIQYYQDAMKFLAHRTDDPHFFIFSDDPVWTQENLVTEYNVTYVTHNDATHDSEDLRLMSQCQHHIIANSTFSWWSAWLSENKEKCVIAPQQWFRNEDRNTSDIYLDSWYKF